MKSNKTRLKAKVPTHPRPGLRLRRLAIEILFFVALAVFGFSAMNTIIGGRSGEGKVLLFPAMAVDTVVETGVTGLYEAASRRPVPEPSLSPIFMPSVRYWAEDLLAWGEEYGLDPNLIATVMQIESCGNPQANSSVGAMGLFQVMPFHFEEGEEPYDPDTNALRGMNYLLGSLEVSGGHAGLALAGYNGGHGVISRSYEMWPRETQIYYRWGSGIYREASAGWESSPTLVAWLAAGGQSLCDAAEEYLEIGEGVRAIQFGGD